MAKAAAAPAAAIKEESLVWPRAAAPVVAAADEAADEAEEAMEEADEAAVAEAPEPVVVVVSMVVVDLVASALLAVGVWEPLRTV